MPTSNGFSPFLTDRRAAGQRTRIARLMLPGLPAMFCAALMTTLLCGCGSSAGYMDYAALPGPDPQQRLSAGDSASRPDSSDNPSATPSNQAAPETPETPNEETGHDSAPAPGIEQQAGTATTGDTQSTEQKSGATESQTDTAGTTTPNGDDKPSDPNADSPKANGTAAKPQSSANSDTAGTGDNNSASPDKTSVHPASTQDAGTPEQAGGTTAATGDSQTPAEPREIKLLVPQKRFRKEGDRGALRVSYDDLDLLKVLNMEPVPVDAVKYFPDWLKNLDGQRIRIRGFMYPTFEATGLTWFRLARDNQICCFQREPKVYDVFDVILAEGETTDYIENKPFDVEGIFRIVPEADDSELYQLYRIEDARVIR